MKKIQFRNAIRALRQVVLFLPWVAFAAMAVAGCGGDGEDGGEAPPSPPCPLVCNGSEDLCLKHYDEVAYATTHNAFSHADGPWIFPNQDHSILRQLLDGVRALMIDIHPYDGPVDRFRGEPFVCHVTCWGGGEPLVQTLDTIRAFLEASPNEVVTLIFESYVSREEVAAAFEESGLVDFCFTYRPEEGWPTLEEMISRNKRLVVLTDFEGGSPDWYHAVWDLAWETDFDAQRPEDLTCDKNRGDADNDLFILNHFLTAPVASERLARQVNFNPFLLDRAHACEADAGQATNFVTVDFYGIGDLLEAVCILNGLEDCP